MAGERLILGPVSETTANVPLELVGQDGHGITVIGHDYPPPPRSPQFAGSPDTEGSALVHSQYENREIPIVLRVSEPSDAAATNLATNPRCASGTTGWTNSGLATMERSLLDQTSTPDGLAGAETALHAVGNSDLDYAYLEFSATSGQSYTFSAWVYLDTNSATGVRLVIYNAAGSTLKANSSTHSTLDSWTRLSATVTADATATWRVGLQQVGSGAADAYGTMFLLTNSSSVDNYFDGDTPGCDWSSTHHASSSTRPATGGPRFYAILRDLQQSVDRINREGGTFKRVPPGAGPAVFDVVQADLTIPADNVFVHSRRAEVGLSLTAKPFWRSGEWVQQSDNSETSLNVLTFTSSSVTGQVPALAKLVVDEDQGQDQRSLIWGVQSRYYDSASNAALFYEAEGRTLATSAAIATRSGGSGGASNNVVAHTGLITSWQTVLTTQATGGGSHLGHVGDFRVIARVYDPNSTQGDVKLRLVWGEQDFRTSQTNAEVSAPVVGDFSRVDLGQVHLSPVISGTQRWEGRIQAKASTIGADIEIDWIWLVPITEGSGEVTGLAQEATVGVTLSAYDDWSQAAGVLHGKTAPLGGTWTSNAGDATDFSVHTDDYLYRSEVSDAANTGHYAYLGASNFTDVLVTVDVKVSGYSTAILQGPLARYGTASPPNNWFGAFLAGWGITGVNPGYYVKKRVGGTVTTIASGALGGGDLTARYYTITLYCASNGYWFLWINPQGQESLTLINWGYESTLVTGGSLETGRPGVYDENTSASAYTRYFDNFTVSSIAAGDAVLDAAAFASQSCEIRHDSVIRENTDGTLWAPPGSYEGDYLRLPVSAREDRTLRTTLSFSRGVMGEGPDSGIDDVSARYTTQARGLIVPEPT